MGLISDSHAVIGSRDTASIRLLKREDHQDANLFAYDPAYSHAEAFYQKKRDLFSGQVALFYGKFDSKGPKRGRRGQSDWCYWRKRKVSLDKRHVSDIFHVYHHT